MRVLRRVVPRAEAWGDNAVPPFVARAAEIDHREQLRVLTEELLRRRVMDFAEARFATPFALSVSQELVEKRQGIDIDIAQVGVVEGDPHASVPLLFRHPPSTVLAEVAQRNSPALEAPTA